MLSGGKLPLFSQAGLPVRDVDWLGLPRRFMNEGEVEIIIALIANVRARSVIEFGVNEGRTAKLILANVPTVTFYQGIDVTPGGGYVPAKSVQHRELPQRPGHFAKDDPRFRLVLRRRGSLDLTAADLMRCDVAFIDGDHGRVAVMHDTALARACVRPGGIIIWHDYNDGGTVDVREVLNDMARSGEDILHVEKTWLAFQRV